MLLAVLALAACRRADTGPRNVVPTATSTPISTPLPPIATQAPSGSDDNPLTVLLRPSGSTTATRTASNRLADALSEQTGLTVEVATAATDAEALAALCDSVGGVVNVAWMSGVAVAAAEAQGCGTPALALVRGTGARAATGEAVQLVTREDGNYGSVASLADNATLCRISYDDVLTWLVPTLILRRAGVEPTAIDDVADYEDVDLLLAAVADGDCDAAGVPESALDDADADVRNALTVLGESAAMPYGVLIYPVEMPLAEREALEAALFDLMADEDAGEPLRDLLDADALERVDGGDFDALREFVEDAGVDLARMGA